MKNMQGEKDGRELKVACLCQVIAKQKKEIKKLKLELRCSPEIGVAISSLQNAIIQAGGCHFPDRKLLDMTLRQLLLTLIPNSISLSVQYKKGGIV